MEQLEQVLNRIDVYNARDPRKVDGEGYELVFSRWMSRWLERLKPRPCACLQVAARGLHIGRWEVPRQDYPAGLKGYFQWKEGLKIRHAAVACGIMNELGCPPDSVERVGELIRRERLGDDPGAQLMEDAVCLVFLERQLEDFASGHPDEKVIDILQKTWPKMSEQAHALALQIPLSSRMTDLVGRALQG